MKKEFTLDDVKTGMIIQMHHGGKYLVVNDCFISCDGYMVRHSYGNDLRHKYKDTRQDPQFDIDRVWSLRAMYGLKSMLETDWTDENRFGHKIYDRFDPVPEEMTLEAVCKELGRKIKIVPNE